MRIFLAEDEAIALRSLQQKIEDLADGWEIVGTAYNGTQALDKIPKCRPDILLTDIRMPDMDGIALVEALHTHKIDVMPVIISGYQEFDYAQQAMRLGVKDYLLKPVDPAQLKKCLDCCRSQIEAKRNKESVVSFLADTTSIAYPPTSLCWCVYLVVANPLSDSSHLQHPMVPQLPSSQIQTLAAKHLPDFVSLHCVDGFFMNEKALFIITPEKELNENTVCSALCAFADDVSALVQNAVTVFYKACDTPEHLNSTVAACRRAALESAILNKNTATSHNPQERRPDPNLKRASV